MKKVKKFNDILSRFRNDVIEYSEKFGGIKSNGKVFKAPVSRKEKRKLERKLKSAKKLAFSRKEKAPTLDDLKKSRSKNKNNETKIQPDKKVSPKDKIKKNPQLTSPNGENIDTVSRIENRIKKENKEKQRYLDSYKNTLKEKLLKDNEDDEKEIRKLEKLLHIKKDSKNYKQAFYDEGFADLLDFCDEEKRQEMVKNEMNAWLAEKESESKETKIKDGKRKKIEQLNSKITNESDNSDQSEIESEKEVEKQSKNDFFIRNNTKKKVKFSEPNESESSGSPLVSDEDRAPLGSDNEEMVDDESISDEDQTSLESTEEGITDDEESITGEDQISLESKGKEIENDDNSISGSDLDDQTDNSEIDDQNSDLDDKNNFKTNRKQNKKESELKEDIYGRLVDKKGNVVKTEKYVPPAQRLENLLKQSHSENSMKLQRLHKQINGLFNRLSTSNIVSILNQIVQMVYSNQYTRYDIMETIYNLIDNSIIKSNSITPHRLIVEHAALISALTTSVGVEFGANLLQRLCQKLNKNLTDHNFFNVENKTFDNLVLFLSNLYHFKLFSSNLLIDLLSDNLIELIDMNEKLEKIIDLILIILRSVGFSLRKDAPVLLKELVIKLQSKINSIKSNQSNEEINNRLKFMIESINAIKNNDMRRLDTFDQQPIELIRKQMKNSFKEDQILLNISYKDLVNVEQTGRWWIVGSAWSNREVSNEKVTKKEENKSVQEGLFSEKILKLAKEQRMNTDIRKAIFCIIISAEDYTDAFIKLVKLSLKKQQEREIIYVIVHCALNEKKSNPYYSFLMQKFCEYDRRFRMTLQFHTWDKVKMMYEMKPHQISNFAAMYYHLIATGAMSLSVLKNVEFGEMNKYLLQFLSELFSSLLTKQNNEKIQEMFMKIATAKKLYQLRNAIRLFIRHFLLTDRGKEIEIDENYKEKCEFAEKILSLNSND